MQEFSASGKVEWRPYVYWRRIAYSGKYINIDRDGIRRSDNPKGSARAPVKIFVFGGSAVWGPWARDEHTLPSEISRTLKRRGVDGCTVTNFGESGYVSTQDLIQLLLELKRGNVPDLAVFYNGVNDVFSAFQNKVAGLSLNESHRREEFNSLAKTHIFALIERSSSLAKALYNLKDKISQLLGSGREEHSVDKSVHSGTFSCSDSLADEVVQNYLSNARLIQALSHEYHFEAHIFWQPDLFSKYHLSPEERTIEQSFPREAEEFFKQVDSMIPIRTSGLSHFQDLQNIFNSREETVFIDYCHVQERWNELVANSIVNSILEDGRSFRE